MARKKVNKSSEAISHKIGLPPGTLFHVGRKRTEEVKITVIDYSKESFEEVECKDVNDCLKYKDKKSISWINIDGLHNTQLVGQMGKSFNLHPLLQEDVLNTKHRPKVEEFDDCLFLTLKMLGISENGNAVISEQVSFVLGDTWLLSFQEEQGDIFESLRSRLRENKGPARHKGSDYLLYRLIDTIVDNYFYVTEHLSEVNERLEEKVLIKADTETLHEIQKQKKLIMDFRKSINPLRDAVATLQKDGTNLIDEGTVRYLRDVYEHIIQVNDSIETQREVIANIMDLYLSGVSNKMNQVMQMLTIISTIFIPLTFIAGIYGMNFNHMPELQWKYGYHAVWGLMIVVLILMLIFFKRKKWL